MAELITKEILNAKFKDKMLNGKKVMVQNPVNLVEARFGANIPANGSALDDQILALINNAIPLGRNQRIALSGKYQSGFDYPFSKRGSIHDRIRKGSFKDDIAKVVFADGNTLNDNWVDLIDAIRMDLTIRKEGQLQSDSSFMMKYKCQMQLRTFVLLNCILMV